MAKYGTVQFRVKPKGKFTYDFPIDMLRYDSCYPDSENDSAKIIEASNMTGSRRRNASREDAEPVEITLRHFGDSHWGPTKGRWESFGWVVSEY